MRRNSFLTKLKAKTAYDVTKQLNSLPLFFKDNKYSYRKPILIYLDATSVAKINFSFTQFRLYSCAKFDLLVLGAVKIFK